ncbi:MAG: DUF3800 domain-containing protein [Chloroflexi bacterium]|nr:DUF3800 domain-containing protein [Chloroflexota bacterium]
MTSSITHVAYSDESYQTASRYRSVAVITLNATDESAITLTFGEILRKSGISEFKWEKLRQARERFAALKMLDKTMELAIEGRLRADVLIWDTHDSRHQIPGRDDVANLQRMYYHLLKNVLQRRWPAESIWKLHPDENTAMDWMTVQDFLDAAGLEFRIDSNLFEGGFRLRLERDFSVLQIVEVCSAKTPLSQLADLFAGLGAFSHSAYDRYESWLHSQSGQMSLFGHEPCKVSNREQERFTVIKHLDEQCKKHKLGVGLRSSRGFRTYNPAHPINFWLYEPQHPVDKAPTREVGEQ